jgi:uncharacterized protein
MIPNDMIFEGFDGTVRLFPLPNLVLFPHVIQGLHLFEARYRELAADSIATNSMFAMALLEPGWAGQYDQAPKIASMICIGHISEHEKLPDGRYHMQLRGVSRAKILEEIPSGRLYRTARVELITEDRPDDTNRLMEFRRKLANAVVSRFHPSSKTRLQLDELFAGESPLGHLCDLLAYALPLRIEIKYLILATVNVWKRVEILLAELGTPDIPLGPQAFPPEFSVN